MRIYYPTACKISINAKFIAVKQIFKLSFHLNKLNEVIKLSFKSCNYRNKKKSWQTYS